MSDKKMMTRDELLMKTLCKFFSTENNLEKMQNVLKRETLTLRVLDWFVTIYSKEHKDDDYVYKKYKLQLKSYSKKLFDPFCRGNRIILLSHNNEQIETTVGQLNYFKWVIENKIIESYMKKKDTIEEVMVSEGFKKHRETPETSVENSADTSADTSEEPLSDSPIPCS